MILSETSFIVDFMKFIQDPIFKQSSKSSSYHSFDDILITPYYQIDAKEEIKNSFGLVSGK